MQPVTNLIHRWRSSQDKLYTKLNFYNCIPYCGRKTNSKHVYQGNYIIIFLLLLLLFLFQIVFFYSFLFRVCMYSCFCGRVISFSFFFFVTGPPPPLTHTLLTMVVVKNIHPVKTWNIHKMVSFSIFHDLKIHWPCFIRYCNCNFVIWWPESVVIGGFQGAGSVWEVCLGVVLYNYF